MAKKTTKLPASALAFFREEGRKGGKVGGKARAAALTPAKRKAIARKAAAARWKDKEK